MSMSPVITKFNNEIDKLIKTDTIQSESDIQDFIGLKNIAGKIVNKLGNVHFNSRNGAEGNRLSDLASSVYQATIPTPPAPVEPSNNVGEEVSGRGVGSRRKGKKSSKKNKSKKSKHTKKKSNKKKKYKSYKRK